MPIWALTLERLQRLNDAILRKKAEHDDLLAKSEKDLWCTDLDEFLVEWEAQLALDAEKQTKLRRMGRRASKKIGAGRTRKGKDDDDYEPDKKSKAKAKTGPKAAPKAKPKVQPSAERFAGLLNSKKGSTADVMDLSSDDDFAGLSRSKQEVTRAPTLSREVSMSQSQPASQSLSQSQSEEPGVSRPIKRAAASRAMTFDISSSDGEGGSLGDIQSMVKGISSTTSSRLGSRQPSVGLSQRTVTKEESSDDELMPPPSSMATAGLVTEKKAKAAPKPKPKAEPKKKLAKASTLSPAAKAYAARKAVKASAFEPGSDEEMADPPSPMPKPAARGRPGRAAAAKKPMIVDEGDSSIMDQDDSDDPFEMDDD